MTETLPTPGSDAPVFAEPWQARAFAMVVELHRQGLFSWPQWAQALAARIGAAQQAGDADLGDTYYHHWLAALEDVVTTHAASDSAELAHFRDAWDHAAHRTPHGQAIELTAADLAAAPRRSLR
jgi:nitrile hydratase accessory protein